MQDRKMGLCHFSPRFQLLPSVPKKSWAFLSPVPHHCIKTSIYDLRRAMFKPDVCLLAPVGIAVRKMPRAWVTKSLTLRLDSSSSLEFIIFIFQTEQPCDLQVEIKLKTERTYHASGFFFWQMCDGSALETGQNTRGADAQQWLSNTIPQHHLCLWCPLCYSGLSSPAGMAQQNTAHTLLLPLLLLRTSPGKQENRLNLSSLP